MKQFNNLTMIITANLPYGWKAWKNNTSAEAKGLKFEPAIALLPTKTACNFMKNCLNKSRKLISNI